jgi:hypothetical protein
VNSKSEVNLENQKRKFSGTVCLQDIPHSLKNKRYNALTETASLKMRKIFGWLRGQYKPGGQSSANRATL